jgi:hypothetical protein
MALQNPSFEEAGALPGEARHWTLTAFTSLEVLAGFGAAPEEAQEGFESWYPHLSTIEDVPVVLAFFERRQGFEDFAEGWANGVFLEEFPPSQLVTCPFAGGAVEDCETGWSNVPFMRDWALVTSATGVFDGEEREDFEDEWRGNEAYAWTWGEIISSPALFDAGTRPLEDFEGTWAHASTS